jgi:3-hydroxyisobutyrate dehydrogenase
MSEGKFDSGFAVEWMHKDLSICLSDARRNGASLPVTALLDASIRKSKKWAGKNSACSRGLER